MKQKFLCLIVSILLLVWLSTPLSAQKAEDLKSKIKKYEEVLKQLQKQHNIPSISFAILKGQQIVYSSAMGFADIKNNTAATDSTIYSIASLTKPIAATLIMRLVEQGKINLDSPMHYYWQEYEEHFSRLEKIFREEMPSLLIYMENFHYKENAITVRQHLSHTAQGIPGTDFKYNGFLYGRLSNMVDKVVPSKFYGLMDSLILKKLNMSHSVLQFNDLAKSGKVANLAKPYIRNEKNNSLEEEDHFPDPNSLNAGAGLLLSVKDLAKFDMAFDKNELIAATTKALMLTPTISKNGKPLQYGLGWFVTNWHNQPIYYHYGLQESYSGFWLKIPNKNITLIVLANSLDLTASYNKFISAAQLESIPYVAKFLNMFAD